MDLMGKRPVELVLYAALTVGIDPARCKFGSHLPFGTEPFRDGAAAKPVDDLVERRLPRCALRRILERADLSSISTATDRTAQRSERYRRKSMRAGKDLRAEFIANGLSPRVG